MSHPPTLAVAIAGALALVTAIEAYHTSHISKPVAAAAATTQPVQQPDLTLHAIHIGADRGSASPL